MSGISSRRDTQFEEYLRDGITAARSGNRKLAQILLNRSLVINKWDARPYIWLSATTDDPDEQREYLEQAVAVEPSNVSARRGLAMLTGKIDESRLVGKDGAPRQDGEQDAQSQSFKCPQCGGKMTYAVQHGHLACEYCGYVHFERMDDADRGPHPIADTTEQVLDFVIPTTHGHTWAEAQHRLSCEHCGAISLLAAGQKVNRCAYCGSNQLIDLTESGELIDPHVIAVMHVDEKQAMKGVREWLGRGTFVPDDLLQAALKLRLRPAYYSAWVFDGTIEVHWSCEVAEGSGRSRQWESRNGTETQFFSDVLVPGVRSLKMKELVSIEPFNLTDVEEFSAEFLAGWPTVIYNRSLSDSSLLAREKVLKKMRPQIHQMIEIGREKRNVNIGGGKWSGMTFKHILLPIWIGAYHYQDKEYHLLVNGQTGKVGGGKPRDNFKLFFVFLIVLLFIGLVAAAYWLWTGLQGV